MRPTIFALLVVTIATLCIDCSGAGTVLEGPPTDTTSASSQNAIPNGNVIVVDASGTGNYATIQKALENTKPGDVVEVKNGTYTGKIELNKAGVTLRAYNGHKPVLKFKPWNSAQERVEITAPYVTVEGFRIEDGYDGIKVFAPFASIKNNYITNSRYQGILITSVNNVLIDNNVIEKNGVREGGCTMAEWGGRSPRHCHGIYISDFSCKGSSNHIITNNTIRENPGRGIQWNGYGCGTKMTGTMVEGNTFENNSWGIVFFHNADRNVIQNNKFIANSYPEVTNDDAHYSFCIYNSTQNVIKNNKFTSTLPEYFAFSTQDRRSSNNFVDQNTWNVSSNMWRWNNKRMDGFREKYVESTGWDLNGTVE